MRRTDDVEFRAGDGSGSAPREEVLDVGRARHRPHRLWPRAAAGLLLLAAAVAVGRATSDHRPAAGSGDRTTTTRPATVGSHPPGPPLNAGRGDVLDVAAGDRHIWVLHADRVTGLSVSAGRNRSAVLPALDVATSSATFRLVPDASAARLWVVRQGTRRGRAIEYDLPALTLVREVRLPGLDRAAAMSGHLYATSGRELIDVPPRGAARTIPVAHMPGAVGQLVADPARSRLLMLGDADPTHIWAYRPGRGLTRTTRLPLANASIAVTEQAIWLAGYADNAAVLQRLDPATLRPVLTDSLYAPFKPGAVLLAGGTRDLWLVTGGIHPSLWCVDDRNGARAQSWPMAPQAVAASSDGVVALNGTRIVPLALDAGCTG
jgi:hypothetical protein